jgi:hypothetical protein
MGLFAFATTLGFWRRAAPILIALVIGASMIRYERKLERALLAAGPDASPRKTIGFGIMFFGESIPLSIPHLTLFGSALAFAFNLGFFWAIRISFMSLFAIQDHIVFALSGLVEVLVVVGAAGALENFISQVDSRHLGGTRKTGRWWIGRFLSISVLAWLAFNLISDQEIQAYSDAGIETALSLASVLICGMVFVLVVRFGEGKSRTNILALIVIGAALSLGAYRGNLAVFSEKQHKSDFALTQAGTRLGIVRIGSDYSILVDTTDKVLAMKTASLLEIASQRGTVAPP